MGVESCLQEATLLTQSGDLNGALSKLESGSEEYPEDNKVAFLYAAALAESKEYDKALTYYDKSLSLDPTFHIARFQFGLLLATLGSDDTAVKVLSPLAKLNDLYLGAFSLGIIATLTEDLDAAEIALKQGIHLNTDNPSLNSDMQNMLSRVLASRNESRHDEHNVNHIENDENDRSHLLDIYQSKR